MIFRQKDRSISLVLLLWDSVNVLLLWDSVNIACTAIFSIIFQYCNILICTKQIAGTAGLNNFNLPCNLKTVLILMLFSFRFKNVLFEITATDVSGLFDVNAKFMGVPMEKVEVVFQVRKLQVALENFGLPRVVLMQNQIMR